MPGNQNRVGVNLAVVDVGDVNHVNKPVIQLNILYDDVFDSKDMSASSPQPPAPAEGVCVKKLLLLQNMQMVFEGVVRGSKVRVLMDSGSEANWTTTRMAKSLGLPISSTRVTKVELANGASAFSHLQCTARLHMGAQSSTVCARILESLPAGVDFILGDAWMRQHDVHLLYSDKGQSMASCLHRKRRIVLKAMAAAESAVLEPDGQVRRPEPAMQDREPTGLDGQVPVLLSAVQFRNCAAKRTFAMQVFPPENDETQDDLPSACKTVLDEFPDVFEPLPPGLPDTHGVGHVIPLHEGAQPPRRRPFRMSPREKEEAEKQVAWLLEMGWIEPSSSPYGSTILFKEKKDGTLRMCVDYRALNQLTVKNRYPLPRIDDLLDQLHGATVFSSLDLQHGYHQIRIADSDVPKTAFMTHRGLYQYKVLCFGLSNAPSSFQAVMNRVLAPVIGKCAVVYMDDILIFSRSMEEHAQHLRLVLQLLRAAKLKCKLTKCAFGKSSIKFLGFLVGGGGLSVDPKKVQVVVDWPTPATPKEVQSFLGLATYFRRFCPGFAAVARPLHRLTHKDVQFEWTIEAQAAFDKIKVLLTTAPVLALPDLTPTAPPFEVSCDASDYAVGAVLVQNGKALAYESRLLAAAEQNYSTGEKELLAVVHAMRTWRCFLEGGKAVVVTDHNPITYLQTQKNLSRRQVRWSEYLQNFEFEWKYRPGTLNPADALSRVRLLPRSSTADATASAGVELPAARAGAGQGTAVAQSGTVLLPVQGVVAEPEADQPMVLEEAEVPAAPVQLGLVLLAVRQLGTSSDVSVLEVRARSWPYNRKVPNVLDRCRKGYEKDSWLARNATRLQEWLQEDGLYRRDGRADGPIYVPDVDTLRREILVETHDTPYGGHLGAQRTIEQVQRLFVWPGMTTDVKEFVDTCHTCQRDKAPRQGPAGHLLPLAVPGRRWESVSMDFITHLPRTSAGNTSIAVFVDRLTKMVHLAALPENAAAPEVARCFLHNVFRLHGLPRELVTDRDSRFTSHFWQEVMRILGTRRSMSTAFHPQSDGQTERMNAVLQDMLRHWVGPLLNNWDQLLDCAEFAINNAKQSSTQDTPFRLNYGQDPLTPLSIEADTRVPCAADFVGKMSDAVVRAKAAMQVARHRQQMYHNRGRRDVHFEEGQKVLLKTTNFQWPQKLGRKLLPKWIGPFAIVSKVGRLAYKLELPPHLKMHPVFHVSLLKLFKEGDRSQPPPKPIVVNGEEQWEVEEIVGERGKGKGAEVLVKWQGFGVEDNTWEPLKHVSKTAREALQAFRESRARR